MDIIAIKSKTFEQMKERFKGFSNQVKDLCGDNQDKEQWLGNEDVCALLQISLRTLQSYRDSGMLPFSLIGRKCYYRVSDMQQLIDNSKRNPDERKIYMDENLFDLSVLVGNWESVNLNPTIIIYRNDNSYLLSVIHMNETSRQASPATYEIQEDEDGFFINYNLKRMAINYDNKLDILTLSVLGDYIRN